MPVQTFLVDMPFQAHYGVWVETLKNPSLHIYTMTESLSWQKKKNQDAMSVNASSTGYLPLGSPFSLAFFCFCCMISASLKYKKNDHIHIQYDALCNSMHLLVVIIFRCCTFACGQLLRGHPHFSSLWDDRFASWHSSDGQVHADFPLQDETSQHS